MIKFKGLNDHLKLLETLIYYEELFHELFGASNVETYEMLTLSLNIQILEEKINKIYRNIQKQFYIEEEKKC